VTADEGTEFEGCQQCGGSVGDPHAMTCPDAMSPQDRLLSAVGDVAPRVGAVLTALAGLVNERDEIIRIQNEDIEMLQSEQKPMTKSRSK
jgi:hypothetical protein